MTQWVILELSPKAEGEDPDIVRRSIRHVVRSAEVFIPAMVTEMGGDKVIKYLVDGYAFIRRDHPDPTYFKLAGTRYVQSIITHPAAGPRTPKQIACVTDKDIERMQDQIRVEANQGIGVGDTVVVTSGAYKQIHAVVIEDIPEMDSVQVQVKLRSKESLVTLPRSFLKLVSKAKRPAYLDKVAALRAWATAAVAVTNWKDGALSPMLQAHRNHTKLEAWNSQGVTLTRFTRALQNPLPEVAPVSSAFEKWGRLETWATKGAALTHFVRAVNTDLDLASIITSGKRVLQLTSWVDRGKALTQLVNLTYSSDSVAYVEAKYLEWSWLQDVTERLGRMLKDVEAIGRVLCVEAGDTVIQNLIIDGHNLAFRCLYAPGMSTLSDTKGRPTGMILVFLRSLGEIGRAHV